MSVHAAHTSQFRTRVSPRGLGLGLGLLLECGDGGGDEGFVGAADHHGDAVIETGGIAHTRAPFEGLASTAIPGIAAEFGRIKPISEWVEDLFAQVDVVGLPHADVTSGLPILALRVRNHGIDGLHCVDGRTPIFVRLLGDYRNQSSTGWHRLGEPQHKWDLRHDVGQLLLRARESVRTVACPDKAGDNHHTNQSGYKQARQ
jgi:hypothetical protein